VSEITVDGTLISDTSFELFRIEGPLVERLVRLAPTKALLEYSWEDLGRALRSRNKAFTTVFFGQIRLQTPYNGWATTSY
jgi:hypothetical protein